jgi:hypothetical protein
MLANPSGSHRRAPFLTSPKSATPTSISSTARNTGTAMRMNVCGCTWAATHMRTSASTMFKACAPTRPGAW